MEREDDVQLIQRTLSGDDTAFGILLRKHQKSVHALVWRKIGDFHIAEDITQDTFLQAYKKLSTLKNHSQFAGWLYVIADRLCIDWSRKRRFVIDPVLKHRGFCKCYAEALVDFRSGWSDSTEMPTILLNKTIGLMTPKPKEATPSLRMLIAAFWSRSRCVSQL